jgi:hypothetical protein
VAPEIWCKKARQLYFFLAGTFARLSISLMGKVTYAIGFKNELPYEAEIKQQRRVYTSQKEKGNGLKVAETARQLAETLLDQSDELAALDEDPEVQEKSLIKALDYCNEAKTLYNNPDHYKELLRYVCRKYD